MLNLNKNKLIPATEIIAYWGEIKGDISKQTDLVDYVTGKDNDIKTWVESQSYLTSLSLNGYVQETNLKTINGESLVGEGDIVIQTTAENIECGPVSTDNFEFSNVNEGLIQIVDSVEGIIINKEDKVSIRFHFVKNSFYTFLKHAP